MVPPHHSVADTIQLTSQHRSQSVTRAKGVTLVKPSTLTSIATQEMCPAEVVWVYEQFKLIDAESYQRVYSRRNGRQLVKGYYVVSWPAGRGDLTFGDEAVFCGPYGSRKAAEMDKENIHRQQLGQRLIRTRPNIRRTKKLEELPQAWVLRQNHKAHRISKSRLH